MGLAFDAEFPTAANCVIVMRTLMQAEKSIVEDDNGLLKVVEGGEERAEAIGGRIS